MPVRAEYPSDASGWTMWLRPHVERIWKGASVPERGEIANGFEALMEHLAEVEGQASKAPQSEAGGRPLVALDEDPLRRERDEAVSEVERLRRELDALRAEHERSCREAEHLHDRRLRRVEMEKDALKEAVDFQVSRVEALQAKNHALESERDTARKALRETQRASADQEKLRANAEARAAVAETRAASAEVRLSGVQREKAAATKAATAKATAARAATTIAAKAAAKAADDRVRKAELRYEHLQRDLAIMRPRPPEAPAEGYGTLARAVTMTDLHLVGESFASWCRGAGGNVGQISRFSEFLRSANIRAEVRAVYRDLDSARLPVTYSPERAGASAEYWLVEGVSGLWLLPCPQGLLQFRDLEASAFGGVDVAPRAVKVCRPARVRVRGDDYEVEEGGMLA